MRTKHRGTFSDVPAATFFYTKRWPNGCEADSLRFHKSELPTEYGNAWNPEFGDQTIHPDQPCWWYTE